MPSSLVVWIKDTEGRKGQWNFCLALPSGKQKGQNLTANSEYFLLCEMILVICSFEPFVFVFFISERKLTNS